jgi:hypothetical protein
MSKTKILLPIDALDSRFPLKLGTIYNHHWRGSTWVTNEGPRGPGGRVLWIDVRAFNRWAQLEGFKFRLELDHPRAVQVEVSEQPEEVEEGAS